MSAHATPSNHAPPSATHFLNQTHVYTAEENVVFAIAVSIHLYIYIYISCRFFVVHHNDATSATREQAIHSWNMRSTHDLKAKHQSIATQIHSRASIRKVGAQPVNSLFHLIPSSMAIYILWFFFLHPIRIMSSARSAVAPLDSQRWWSTWADAAMLSCLFIPRTPSEALAHQPPKNVWRSATMRFFFRHHKSCLCGIE